MSLKLNIISGRKEDLEKLIKAIAEFWGNCPNERLTVDLTIEADEKGD